MKEIKALPILVGTPKQVAWAEKIRINTIEKLENGSLDSYIKGTLDFKLKVNATEENTKAVIEKIVKMLKEETDSVFFIEKVRGLDGETLLKELMKDYNIIDVDFYFGDTLTSNKAKSDDTLEAVTEGTKDERAAKTYELLKEGYEVYASKPIARRVFNLAKADRDAQLDRLFK